MSLVSFSFGPASNAIPSSAPGCAPASGAARAGITHQWRASFLSPGTLASMVMVAAAAAAGPAQAQVQLSGKALPLALAQEAAREAIRSCEASGYRVSASVVDVAGVERAFLRGDNSTVHTRETAFKKAYTIATLGPIFDVTTTGSLTEKINKTPTGPALSSVNNIILLAGGVAIRSGHETLAALGVGGAPGGALDERCAVAGVEKIQEQVTALTAPKP